MKPMTILRVALTLGIAVSVAGCADKTSGSDAGYSPPAPKTTAQIHQEIDANTKLTPAMKQALKEQVATGVSGSAPGGGEPGALPADVAGYLKSSGASKNAKP
ncbi:MAG: hypothetical protein H8F28_21465 [Fibrella sp.]|nr:hypothetical protein [Armatimonadota bacterium]